MNTQTKEQIEFTRVNNDINGNPRHVCHFLAFINNEDSLKAHEEQGMNAINYLYSLALCRSRELGGKKFHNKQYGGGIVFQEYGGSNLIELENKILEIKNSN